MKLEICIDSLEGARTAIANGADRLEICGSLDLDGISPSLGLVSLLAKEKNIEKFVMVRPRPYDFCYTDQDFETMKEEIRTLKSYDIDGFVFGILKTDGTIDLERTKILVDLCSPKKVCFHRAFDYAQGGDESIKDLISMGVVRILTSGRKEKAIDGCAYLRSINKKYGKDIEIMAGSGVSYKNIEEIYRKTGIENFHLSGKKPRTTAMTYLRENPLYQDLSYPDPSLIKKAREAIDKL
ncbi:copper homeostasis protein CutC [uncultured Anaerococcus sp.]|uniref:copper homeostasis protein CutC n=1 Tax=uncultured Anaerococcus sp. TaxID=293428 RepID=UPI00260CE01E|nr:copper homeostasis protein CutC [uncultured Anaerococcus sp.]